MTLTVLPVLRPRTVHRPYVLLGLLQVLDVLTTGFILRSWSDRSEGNPVARFILDEGGLYPGLGVLLAFKLAMVVLLWSCQTKVRFAATIYTAVILNNLLFILLWLTQR